MRESLIVYFMAAFGWGVLAICGICAIVARLKRRCKNCVFYVAGNCQDGECAATYKIVEDKSKLVKCDLFIEKDEVRK